MRKIRWTFVAAVALAATAVLACWADFSGLSGGQLAGGGPSSDGAASDANATVINCPVGFADCDRDSSNGCETRVLDSVEHCGACQNACSTGNDTSTCVDGTCQLICPSGLADCDGNPKNGCETDVSADSLNCGACAHKCTRPSTCLDRVCTPTRITSGLVNPGSLAVGKPPENMIYVRSDPNTLYSVSAIGGGQTLVTSGVGDRISVEGGRVYFLLGSGLGWCDEPCTGGISSRPFPIVTTDFWVGPSKGFFTYVDFMSSFSPIYTFDIPLTAGDATVPFRQVGNLPVAQANSVTADDDYAYGAATNSTTASGIFRGLRDGGTGGLALSTIITGGAYPARALLATKGRLFFTTTQGQLHGCLPANCAATDIVYGPTLASTTVAVDDKYVYFADEGTSDGGFADGRILRCPLAGCVGSPTEFARGEKRPRGIGLAAEHIYWSNQGDGTIMRVDK